MMQVGELREHPDWKRFLSEFEKVVDKARHSVLVASEREDIESVRYRAGMYNALRMAYEELKG